MSKDADIGPEQTPPVPENTPAPAVEAAAPEPPAAPVPGAAPAVLEPSVPPVPCPVVATPLRPHGWVLPVVVVIAGLLVLSIGARVAFGLARHFVGGGRFTPGMQQRFMGRDGGGDREFGRGCPNRSFGNGEGRDFDRRGPGTPRMQQRVPGNGYPRGRGFRGGTGSTTATVTPQSATPSY